MCLVRRLASFVLLVCSVPALCAQSTTPVLSQPLPAQLLPPNSGPVTINLRNHFSLPGVNGQVAQVETSLGKFNLELFILDTPRTVENFLAYIAAGRWTNTIVHRSVPNFVIQMGGYTAVLPPVHVATFAPVQNEFRRSNLRGTVAMAKIGGDPNSATSEFFVNLGDNSANLDNQNGGFTVFARVLGTGMTVVDSIAALPFFNVTGTAFDSLPLRDVRTGQTSIEVGNLVVVNRVTAIPVFPEDAGGTSVLSFSASSSNSSVVAASVTGTTLTLTPAANGTATVTVTATDTNGNAVSSSVSVTVGVVNAAPLITSQPPAQIRMATGTVNTVAFSVVATGFPAPVYQWKRNGTNVTGQTTATYVLTNASEAQAGSFTCVVSNSLGTVESAASVLSFIPTASPGRLINLSILTGLDAGESMTLGTVLGGPGTTGTKPLLVRAAGPALAQLGVTGFLPDPQMKIAGPSGNIVAENNDWAGTSSLVNAFQQVAAFAYASPGSKDAAVFRSDFAIGGHTVQVGDFGTGSGTVIAELYDSTPDAAYTPATPRLINVSVLKQVSTGTMLTAGFVIGGTTAKTVLVRAIGPGLLQFNVQDTMSDPQLALVNQATGARIGANDNWGGDLQLTTAGSSVGAFPPGSLTSTDAMLLVTLAPGNYSAQVTAAGAGGKALVEVYEVP